MKGNVPSRRRAPWAVPLRDVPIRRKLMLIVMATTALALLLAGIGIVSADLILYRRNLKDDLSALAHIIADNTTAALSFDDPAAANETLAALRSRPHVVTACVFKNSTTPFARYVRPGATLACPVPQPDEQANFDQQALTVSHPILLNGRRVGTLVLVYDLGAIYERLQLYGVTVVAVFVFSTLIAFLLSSRLRSLITTPIIELAHVTARVSDSRDYSIRAEKVSGDELGRLVDGFNEMLSGIQSRDNELRKALLAREAALSELRTSNESLARSNEDLERFAFIASHDLQEPLRMITVYSQLLVRRFAGLADPQAAGYIEIVENGTKRMRELLADLLAYAEIGAKLSEPARPVDLNLVVQKVRQNLAVAISESGASITAARLPMVFGFESHFIPMFQNLIGNAIKYRSDKPLQIDIAAGRVQDHVQFRVSDNGIGIAHEYHSKIFVAFKRLHGNKIPGTGIGLAICQRVVERYGGRIWVESELGRGANFVFILPASLLAEQSFVSDN